MAKIRKILGFLKKHKLSSFIVFLAVVVSAFFVWQNYSDPLPFKAPSLNITQKKETRVRAPLSGVLVDPALAARRPIAVVIENHPDARSQTGFSNASLVYETLAEGGITRTLAIFQENDSEVGPVRSARTQFVYWAKELEAIFAHAGGSKDALALIGTVGVLDFNHNTTDFWRDNSRYAPHNLYSTTEKLRAGGKKAGYSETDDTKPFIFKDDEKLETRPESQSITINFSSFDFKVGYVYDKINNNYKRSVGGKSHTDKLTGKQLTAKNIVVQFANVSEKSGGDTQVQVIGSGKTKYFIDGKSFEGTWKKADSGSRTKYLNSDGKEIELNAGITWIEVVRTGSDISVE